MRYDMKWARRKHREAERERVATGVGVRQSFRTWIRNCRGLITTWDPNARPVGKLERVLAPMRYVSADFAGIELRALAHAITALDHRLDVHATLR